MKHFALLCAALTFGACGHPRQQSFASPADSLSHGDSASRTDSAADFFPVADVLESEIREVDTTPVAITEYIIRRGKTDSSYLKPAEFEAAARQFLMPEFRNGDFEKNFTESSFIDNATQEATFTYSTTNKDEHLQRVDVVTAPQGTVHRLKSVYLERNRVSGDSSILDKMYWRAGKGFEVISLIRIKGGAPAERRVKVVWGGGDENE